jgi:toxin ParE1/3/4
MKASRLDYTAAALADLDTIYWYIAGDSVLRAETVLERLIDAIERLIHTPRMGHRRLEYGADIRTLPANPFVVFYRAARAVA